MVTVHNFSYGLLNPVLAYATACLGAFLGLCCVTRARARRGARRASWLTVAAVSIGATGIWAMHFIAMLGFTIPGQQILYNVPITIESMLLAILVVGLGLFIVGYGRTGWRRVVSGGVIIGFGVANMHYMGMAAMVMPDAVHYNVPLVALSVLIAVVAGTASLRAGTRVHAVRSTIAPSLIMGAAVTGMHYTGMAAMRVGRGSMPAMSGSTAFSFVVPLVVGLTAVTFVIAMAVSLAPTADEIAIDAVFQRRIDEIKARRPLTDIPWRVARPEAPGPGVLDDDTRPIPPLRIPGQGTPGSPRSSNPGSLRHAAHISSLLTGGLGQRG